MDPLEILKLFLTAVGGAACTTALNNYLQRGRNRAETVKLRAEGRKLDAEADHLEVGTVKELWDQLYKMQDQVTDLRADVAKLSTENGVLLSDNVRLRARNAVLEFEKRKFAERVTELEHSVGLLQARLAAYEDLTGRPHAVVAVVGEPEGGLA